jgi:type VI secretion system protein ImpF
MAKTMQTQANLAVTLSVLDRLTDVDPKSRSVEAPLTRAESVRALKAGVRRDLEWLLNTRRPADDPGSEFLELRNSLYIYGLPDFSGYSIASPRDQQTLLVGIQAAVRMFEPRLTGVRVVLVEATPTGTRTLRFRLEGLLIMDPAPEHISFDTTLKLTTGDYKILGEADA